MRFLRGLLWVVVLIAAIAGATYLTGRYDASGRFTEFYLAVQAALPVNVDYDQFLVALTVVSLLTVAIVVIGCSALLVVMGVRLSAANQRAGGQATAAKRETEHVREDAKRQDERLIGLSAELTKRLDKRVIVQRIVEAASRIASAPQANAVVSLWLVHLETDTIRFEIGLYCDATHFVKTEFLPTEQPFANALTTIKPVVNASWDKLGCITPEKAPQLGTATSAILVPMVIEGSVLGFLMIYCHADALKAYQERPLMSQAVWGELTLALAIAVQGEVAILDRLTGVHNREYFMKRLVQEIERANRFRLPLSLLMIDIDNFKQVNDTLGHPQGDAVLRIVAKLIKKEVRAVDLAGRYGGEEFIVLLPETGYGEEGTSATGALVVAERIRKAVDDEFRGMQKPLNITVSLGVAVRRFPEEREEDFKLLIQRADEQLYKAKTTGKNKVSVVLPEKEKPPVAS
ncbi:MAG: hypothetical protein COV75_04555 [Candidatus Omnitrophica bacterium CG11_big_fil_rev_8_21_14_0_20_63_9]|nr:MAG: hypothetical protein COV75_04555 [Candidatus Omnitrophica bacterium CG11_big_fil_rev_8_21_14_0_20_63_9]